LKPEKLGLRIWSGRGWVSKWQLSRVLVAHTCNPSYSGGRDQEETSLGKEFLRPYLEKTHYKRRASRVAQGVGPDFKLQYYRKKERRKEGREGGRKEG
jgi:hypothetical protein